MNEFSKRRIQDLSEKLPAIVGDTGNGSLQRGECGVCAAMNKEAKERRTSWRKLKGAGAENTHL